MPTFPDLTDWNGRRPSEVEDEAAELAELIAWSAIDQLTAGRVAFDTEVIRPMEIEADGTVILPRPCGGVKRVTIDGVPFLAWRLDEDAVLQRLDGDTWPAGQDPTLIAGTGVFEVECWHGWRPGRLLLWAAGELAYEFYAATSDAKKCRLPKNVTAVTRQGVTFQMNAPLFSNGRTGIHEIDVVLARYNPSGATAKTTVASVESLARTRRVR